MAWGDFKYRFNLVVWFLSWSSYYHIIRRLSYVGLFDSQAVKISYFSPLSLLLLLTLAIYLWHKVVKLCVSNGVIKLVSDLLQ